MNDSADGVYKRILAYFIAHSDESERYITIRMTELRGIETMLKEKNPPA